MELSGECNLYTSDERDQHYKIFIIKLSSDM